jgi:hypothetical protein
VEERSYLRSILAADPASLLVRYEYELLPRSQVDRCAQTEAQAAAHAPERAAAAAAAAASDADAEGMWEGEDLEEGIGEGMEGSEDEPSLALPPPLLGATTGGGYGGLGGRGGGGHGLGAARAFPHGGSPIGCGRSSDRYRPLQNSDRYGPLQDRYRVIHYLGEHAFECLCLPPVGASLGGALGAAGAGGAEAAGAAVDTRELSTRATGTAPTLLLG